jgi:hypothetical protein
VKGVEPKERQMSLARMTFEELRFCNKKIERRKHVQVVQISALKEIEIKSLRKIYKKLVVWSI